VFPHPLGKEYPLGNHVFAQRLSPPTKKNSDRECTI
jgi:hypothetical protein